MGSLLVAQGGLFQMGVEIPSSSRADCGMCGRFFSAGSHELTILVTQWQVHVKPLCHCVANAVSSQYEHRKIAPTVGDFDYDGVEK